MRVEFNRSKLKLKADYFVIRWGYFGQYPYVAKHCFNLFGFVIVFIFYGKNYTGYKGLNDEKGFYKF